MDHLQTQRPFTTGLVPVLAFVAIAAGCGSVGGNALDLDPGASDGVTFVVANEADGDFATVGIRDGIEGAVVFEDEFVCAVGETGCEISYAGPRIGGSAVLEFRDVAGRTVALYETASAPAGYESIEVSRSSTGAYLREAVLALRPELASMEPVDLAFAWESFTQDCPDSVGNGSVDLELVAHYLYRQSVDAPSVTDFSAELARRMLAYEVARPSEFTSPTRVAAASPASNGIDSCPAILGQLFSAALTISASRAHFSFVAYSTISSIGSIGAGLCAGADDSLDRILAKLDALQNSVDNLQNDLGKLTNFVASAQLDTNLQEFEDLAQDLARLTKSYQILLKSVDAGSLTEFVRKRGGTGGNAFATVLEQERKKGFSTFIDLLQRIPSTSDRNYLLRIDRLSGARFDTLVRALDVLCSSPSTGDLVSLRTQCNSVIETTSSRLVAMQKMAVKLAGDTYDLLEAYPAEAPSYGYDTSVPAAEQTKKQTDAFAVQVEKVVSKYKKIVNGTESNPGLFYLYSGLSQGLVASIKAARCRADQADEPAIAGWVKDAANEYLVTTCQTEREPAGRALPPVYGAVLARYWLKVDRVDVEGREDIANILGVLIPDRNRDPWVLQNNPRISPPYGNGTVGLIGMKVSKTAKPGAFATNGQNFKRSGSKIIDWNVVDGPPGRLVPYLDSWSNEKLKAQGLSLYDQPDEFVYEGMYNWVRYTDKTTAYSNVFYLRGLQRRTQLLCVTEDCSRGRGLSFRNGPQDLRLEDADNGSDRRLYGWVLGGSFIDAN